MREIMFRGIARDFNSRDWVYGSLLDKVYGGYPAILTDAAIEDDGTLFVQPTYVERDSISQYTGLKDKNGKKIFEGDIVKGKIGYCGNPNIPIRERIFAVEYERNGTWTELWCSDYYEFEVIGNIYDNPELLEGNNGQ